MRAIFPTERLRGHTMRDCTKWWGPDRHLLAYFMTRRRDEVYLMGSVPAASWDSEELSLPCPREDFIGSFASFHPGYSPRGRGRDRGDRHADLRPRAARLLERRPIVLPGRRRHPVRPYMAAGGAMAVEDAAVLSRCLATIGETIRPRLFSATRRHG